MLTGSFMDPVGSRQMPSRTASTKSAAPNPAKMTPAAHALVAAPHLRKPEDERDEPEPKECFKKHDPEDGELSRQPQVGGRKGREDASEVDDRLGV